MHESFPIRAAVDEALLWLKLTATTWMDRIQAGRKSWQYRQAFQDVQTLCLFIGYPRSGHSLISSLLDAHPKAIMAHRLDLLKYLHLPYWDLFYLIVKNSERFAQTGRSLTGYTYAVPGQWQGRFEKLQLIGDQESRSTTDRLGDDPTLLARLQALPFAIQFIHVIRNPYDNITTWAIKTNSSLEETIERYFALCQTVADVKKQLPPEDVIDIWHESFVDDPQTELESLCLALGLNIPPGYLEQCAAIVYRSPHKSRHDLPWPKPLIAAVKKRMDAFSFLQSYGYEE